MLRILSLILCAILYGCKDNDRQQSYPYCIKGETITLTATEWNSLWKRDVSNILLYGIEPNGNKVIYKQGVDYELNVNRIRRTPNSRIVDFAQHKVVYDENGKFKWLAEPNRNPELTLPYQVYADYSYSETPVIIQNSNKASPKLRAKINQRKPLKLVVIGTSISFGSHTFEQYHNNSDKQTYHQLIANFISTYYDLECIAINRSTDGGGINQIADLTPVFQENPDLVILEVGMNDHLGVFPDIDAYRSSIEQAIIKFKEQHIDVILTGFFQQHRDWELEYPNNTVLFNQTLQELSKMYSLYFADIYTAFEKIDKFKIYKDFMGDYMHHPTSFAHQFYYLEIVPFFIDKPMSEDILLRTVLE